MATVLIKQIADDYAESTGLAKYDRSRMPGCKDRFAVALNSDGRYITGIDEESYTVRTEDRPKMKAIRESLEKLTGKDLSGISPFWEEYYVVIESDKPRSFNTTNPMDQIAIKALIANGIVAPDKDAISNPAYLEAQYYAYTEETEDREEITKRKKRDGAISELLKIQESKDRLLLYGQYLEGLKYTNKLGPDTLYKMLRTYIEEKDIRNAEKFLVAIKLSPEELQQKVYVDRALKQRLISKTSLGGKRVAYQFGNTTLGSTLEEVYNNLGLPDFAPDLAAIIKELNSK
jgi:hypothetical protein